VVVVERLKVSLLQLAAVATRGATSSQPIEFTCPSVRGPDASPCDGETWRLGVATRRWHVLPEHGGWRKRHCDGGVQVIVGTCNIDVAKRNRRKVGVVSRVSQREPNCFCCTVDGALARCVATKN
jgi:hypothetical protein